MLYEPVSCSKFFHVHENLVTLKRPQFTHNVWNLERFIKTWKIKIQYGQHYARIHKHSNILKNIHGRRFEKNPFIVVTRSEITRKICHLFLLRIFLGYLGLATLTVLHLIKFISLFIYGKWNAVLVYYYDLAYDVFLTTFKLWYILLQKIIFSSLPFTRFQKTIQLSKCPPPGDKLKTKKAPLFL